MIGAALLAALIGSGNDASVIFAVVVINALVPLVACNDSRVDDDKVIGDPMEAVLLVLAAKGKIVREMVERDLPRLAEVPFDSAHKFMATFHRGGDHVTLFVKGAPDVLLARCATWRVAGSEKLLTSQAKVRSKRIIKRLANKVCADCSLPRGPCRQGNSMRPVTSRPRSAS